MSEATARLKTSGMHCSSCSMLVDLTLGDLPGVVSSKTDHASGDTVVTFDSDAVTVDGSPGSRASRSISRSVLSLWLG